MPRPSFRPLLLVFAMLIVALGQPLLQGAATAAAPVTHGLKGEYFKMSAPGARDFAVPGDVTLDPQINFSDLVSTFQSATGQSDHTTARWTGQLDVPTTGAYTFYAIGDNGFRLFIDGAPVIDHWVGDWDREQTSAAVDLAAGVQHDFRLEMFQDVGGANMFLRWSSASIAKSIVPESAFTPPAGFQIYPVAFTVQADGLHLEADFEDAVTNFDQLDTHLVVEADTTPMPITSVTLKAGDPSIIVVTLAESIFKSAKVKVTYDGAGGLAVAGVAVPKIIRNASNVSTQRMMTEWGKNLDPNNPLPEYPRPQQVRKKWLNLNGPWQFAGAAAGALPVFGSALGEQIIVPFPVESQLSGLERHEDHMFYRKLISVPEGWRIGSGQRLKLNFGAVDNHARVWINGKQVADHTGGYTAFSADITDALTATGQQEIVVAVTDTTGDEQPIGKQNRNPGGIVYTATSGIWQTVWMEPVPDVAIDDLVTTPDIATATLAVMVKSSATAATVVTATARDKDGKPVGSVTGVANTGLTLKIDNQHLWTPDDPYLYDLKVTLASGAKRDTLTSYFGMRSVGIAKVGGYQKLVLNGKPIFSLAQLDQGFWPDGLYTAPSDAALKFDLQAQKDLGFNAVRKHIKVEPARWYYHADQLGLMVWQDFVSGTFRTEQGKATFIEEGRREVAQLHNSPSIVGWIVFNEGWGEWDRTATGELADAVKAADPSRIVNAHSGVNCCDSKGDSGKGDIIDHHDYGNTEPPLPDAKRAAMDGEHGGFTLRTPGHMWPGNPLAIYSGVQTKDALTKRYVENTDTFYVGQARDELSGSVYTQVTDLEHEINGMWTYDRRVLKVDLAAVSAANHRVLAAGAAAGTPREYPGNAYWALDEGTGSVSADGTGKSPLTLTNGVKWTTGVRQGALQFDGLGSYAETAAPVIDTTGDYTVAAWVTLDALPGNYGTAISQDGRATANPFYLQYGQGSFAFSMPGDVRARLPIVPVLGRWYHLVGVRDHASNELRLYVDGQRAATVPAGTDGVSTGPLSLGRAKYAGQKGDFWPGSIDEVHAFNRALDDTEIAALYTNR